MLQVKHQKNNLWETLRELIEESNGKKPSPISELILLTTTPNYFTGYIDRMCCFINQKVTLKKGYKKCIKFSFNFEKVKKKKVKRKPLMLDNMNTTYKKYRRD